MILTDSHAEMNKERTGKKYQPSNGSEGLMFLEAQCGNCAYKADCTIPAWTMAFSVGDEEYPSEWVYGDDGQPCCTAFKSSGCGA